MKLPATLLTLGLSVTLCPLAAHAADPIELVLEKLNDTRSVQGTKDAKSYHVLFEAYLNLDEPPLPIGETFNQETIHPGMEDWSVVVGWAESNPEMTQAILAAGEKTLFGLPYGAEEVESEFREAQLVADIGYGGSLRDNRFSYLDAIDTIAAFATVEAYRLMEAGQIQEGLDLMVANLFVLRQCCDREFLAEQLHSINMLTTALSNMRDIFYVYRDSITHDQYREIAVDELPFLRPDRRWLFMPEGDRVVSDALIKEVFDARGQADREKFAATFAEIQSREEPLTRFGAARRWAKIAEVHDSLDTSLDRLNLVYDDWYRRWRVQEYDPILGIATQFERTNPVRYAAVIYSMQNIEELFDVRNVLMAHVYGTSMAAGTIAYQKLYGTYSSNSSSLYAQSVRKSSDKDPFDPDFAPFKYRTVTARTPIDTYAGRLWLESGDALLYSRGTNLEDDRGSRHTEDGAEGDIVLWPPIKAKLREEGLID